MFDINKFLSLGGIENQQYEKRIGFLHTRGIETTSIETAVSGAVHNLKENLTRSFVIYGEPQSGKTEMMIALTAKLLDSGYTTIVHLLNDNVSLLDQNLKRFKSSGLAPSPVNFKEILDRSVKIDNRPFIIFCKKNQSDLNLLIKKLDGKDELIIIDDEADFASPNSKIKKNEISKINLLIAKLLRKKGIYIGVTATPARLDLNNTFENEHEKWVNFPPHKVYTGQKIFFPSGGNLSYNLTLISDDAGDDPKHCRHAFFKFLVNSAYLNIHPEINGRNGNNYSFLIHTSGKKIDHQRDYKDIQNIFTSLSDKKEKNFEKYLKKIWEFANHKYPTEANDIVAFIVKNILKYEMKIINSDSDVMSKGTSPNCPFTVIIGGNIVSRGVTFDNLLSMFFTRDVKHKLQQDTYIQRARMFGSRLPYLKYFELTIPENLYADWKRCFVFHELSLKSIETEGRAPVWLSDKRIAAVSPSSIDATNVSLDSGEMSHTIFDFAEKAIEIAAITKSPNLTAHKVKTLQAVLGDRNFPKYLLDFIIADLETNNSKIMLHDSSSIEGSKAGTDQDNISRKKGFMGGGSFTENPDIAHHIKIFYNGKMKARLFYKYTAGVSFLKNVKRSKST